MSNWKTACKWIVIVSLLFLAVPIKIKIPHNEKTVELFHNFMKRYNKTYIQGTDEYDKRFQIFKKTLDDIDLLNRPRLHNLSALYGITQFFDLSQDEFLSHHLQYMKKIRNQNKSNSIWNRLIKIANVNDAHNNSGIILKNGFVIDKGIPMKVDWREKGLISDVKNQGLCGACWAYSVVEVAEAMEAKKSGNLTQLSVQEMVDCASNGNFGCKGGDICNLLLWLKTNDIGIIPAYDYPTTGSSSVCLYDVYPGFYKTIKIKDFTCESYVNRERDLIYKLATVGPVAVAIDALTWQYYLGGVIQYHCPGDDASLNHAVQIVGYDLTADIPYYIIKNSWGKSFGINGYLHIAIGGNLCGIANEVSSLNIT